MASAVVFVVLPSQTWEYRQGEFRKGSSIGLYRGVEDVSCCRWAKEACGSEMRFVQLPLLFQVIQSQDVVTINVMRLPASFQTIPSTPVPHWAEVRRSVPRLRSSLELHIAASARGRIARHTSTHSRNGIPYTLNVYRHPSRAFYGHPRRIGISPFRPAHLDTRRCWIASMEETRFPSGTRTSEQGSRRCRKEIGCEEVWW
jgi:hypothetical protein